MQSLIASRTSRLTPAVRLNHLFALRFLKVANQPLAETFATRASVSIVRFDCSPFSSRASAAGSMPVFKDKSVRLRPRRLRASLKPVGNLMDGEQVAERNGVLVASLYKELFDGRLFPLQALTSCL